MVNVKLIHKYVHDSVMHDYYVLHYITFTLDFFFWCIKTVELKIPKILVAYKLIAWYLLWNDPVFRISV